MGEGGTTRAFGVIMLTTASFINRYIFPGGYLPSITQLLNHITAESKGTLIVEKIENIGGHYARTLRLWREQFLANFEAKIRPALRAEHPDMNEEEVEVFRRKWEVSTAPAFRRTVKMLTNAVLLHVLRGRIPDQDPWRRHHHCWERGSHGTHGGDSPLGLLAITLANRMGDNIGVWRHRISFGKDWGYHHVDFFPSGRLPPQISGVIEGNLA